MSRRLVRIELDEPRGRQEVDTPADEGQRSRQRQLEQLIIEDKRRTADEPEAKKDIKDEPGARPEKAEAQKPERLPEAAEAQEPEQTRSAEPEKAEGRGPERKPERKPGAKDRKDKPKPEKKPAEAQKKAKKTKGGRCAAPKKKGASSAVRFLIKLALVAAIFAVVFTVVLGVHINHGNRMYPFIMDGDLVFTYKLDPYRVGDAVAYNNPATGKVEISRIAAIGENEIQITEIGELLINGSVPNESVFYATKPIEGTGVTFPYRIGQDGYFLLDDFRTVGRDSRMFGEVTEDAFVGKVVYVFRRRGI